MSLRGKDFRCELDPELHERLRMMAEFNDTDVSALGAKLLEKAICGEFHEFTFTSRPNGAQRNRAEDGGRRRKVKPESIPEADKAR